MGSIITDSKYFQNANHSQVTVDTSENDQVPITGTLLLVIKWDETTEFVYDSYSIFIPQDPDISVIEVLSFEERNSKPNDEIIEQYIQDHLQADAEPSVQEIIACNPHVYPPQRLLTEYI